MTRSLRVTALQLAAHDRADFARSFDSLLASARAAAAHADLLVLPEGTLPAYVLGSAPLDFDALDAAVLRFRELAAQTQTAIVVGAAVAVGEHTRNGALVIDSDGSLAGRADKLFLWHFDRRWFEAGTQVAPIETRVGRLGVLVCADGRLPTISRALVDRGAELLVMPTAWVTSGRDPEALENVQADLLARVRAYENGVPFVAANKCGAELGIVAYCGKSQIVDERGEIVARAGQHLPQALSARLTLGGERRCRTPLSQPAHRTTVLQAPVRVGLSFEPLGPDDEGALRLLDDAFALAPDDPDRLATLDRTLPTALVGDELAGDPGGLVPYRRAGYRLIVWDSSDQPDWTERLARTRALELRLYVAVFDRRQRRAYAVDPDGAVVAGTFGRYRIASFSLDPRRTTETAVAPGTDVCEGLERIAAIVERQESQRA